jgi:beta-glucanase (GH16 family)
MRRFGWLITFTLCLGCDVGGSTEAATGGTAIAAGGTKALTGGGPAAAGGAATSGGPATGGSAATTTAGTGTSAGGAATNPPADGDFELLFRDDFDTLDLARWQLMTHSWDGNLALFSTSAAQIDEGMLRITLTPAPEGTVDSAGNAKSFLGAEVRSLDTLTYGRVRARAKLAAGSAVVSSLVTIYTPWPADNWNELDIEHLGAKPTEVQFNAMVYTGPALTPPVTQSVTPTAEPRVASLAHDPSADFHVYTIEWTPSRARFEIDDVVLHEWTTNIDLMTLPQNVLLTIWASGSPGWAGAVNDDTGAASAVYDWIELYRLKP